jgi:hypothetical protein
VKTLSPSPYLIGAIVGSTAPQEEKDRLLIAGHASNV